MVESELNLDRLEELEARIVPLLKRRGIEVQDIQPIGLLGRGANSSVFSLLINNQYHVLKVYSSPASFSREMRNRRRLIWPSPIILTSRHNQNSLGSNLVITKVPEGETFTSQYLLEWVMEKLTDHLLELHSIRRSRTVSAQSLIDRLAKLVDNAKLAAKQFGGKDAELTVLESYRRALDLINSRRSIFRVQHSLIHSDLWWSNVVIARDDVYLIDWESVRTGDYLEDLASLRVMFDHEPREPGLGSFWKGQRNIEAAHTFYQGIVRVYARTMDDETIYDRSKFYLTLHNLYWLNCMQAYFRSEPDTPKRVKQLLADLKLFWQEDSDS